MAGAQRFEDLLAWQRMHEFNLEVWRSTAHLERDFAYRDQIRDAADSTERNIVEGFGRYHPGQFAYFLDISRASALEAKALLGKDPAI